jgi:twitching motility two-component system response regulator PilG
MSEHTTSTFSIAVFGVPEFERQVLNRIFGLSASRTNTYRLLPPGSEVDADIMLVDRDSESAVVHWRNTLAEAAPRHPGTVVVAREQPDDCDFHVRRPFMATRVLGTLDRIVHATTISVPTHPRELSAARTSTMPRHVTQPEATPSSARITTVDERYRALVVDDSMAVRKQIGIALDRFKVNADFADCGEKALALLQERAFDIVFLDVVMPGVDGYDVCKSIKRNRARKHIPVVMLTGRSSPFDKVKGKLSGCNSYLTKPVSGKDFVHTIQKYLKEPISFE